MKYFSIIKWKYVTNLKCRSGRVYNKHRVIQRYSKTLQGIGAGTEIHFPSYDEFTFFQKWNIRVTMT